jgi:hypothetical protein
MLTGARSQCYRAEQGAVRPDETFSAEAMTYTTMVSIFVNPLALGDLTNNAYFLLL